MSNGHVAPSDTLATNITILELGRGRFEPGLVALYPDDQNDQKMKEKQDEQEYHHNNNQCICSL